MGLLGTIFVIAMVTTCHASEDTVNTPYSGELVGFLDKFKEILRKGDTKLGIPVLDPLDWEHFALDISKPGLILNGSLDQINGLGLSNYEAIQGDFTIIGLKANLTLLWKKITLSTEYNAQGTLDNDIEFYGKGDIFATVKNLTVSVDMQIKVNSTTKRLYVRQLELHAYLDELDFSISGLYNDPDLSNMFSKIISDIVPGLVHDYQTQLSQFASPIVANILNDVLKNLTMGDLIGIIGGYKQT